MQEKESLTELLDRQRSALQRALQATYIPSSPGCAPDLLLAHKDGAARNANALSESNSTASDILTSRGLAWLPDFDTSERFQRLRSQMNLGFNRRREEFVKQVFDKHATSELPGIKEDDLTTPDKPPGINEEGPTTPGELTGIKREDLATDDKPTGCKPMGIKEEDLTPALEDLGIFAGKSEVDELFKARDVNRDDLIDWSEFLPMASRVGTVEQWVCAHASCIL